LNTQSYIICSTPRSGTTLLCDLLADTGIAGRPDSFFRRQSIPWWSRYFNVSIADWGDEHEFDQSYLAAVQREGAGETQVFGMRLMWESVADLSQRLETFYPGLPGDSARFRSAFGPPVYIHLSRENKVAQAVSRLKAEQTGLWHVAADGTERERVKPGQALAYDARGIFEQVAESKAHDAASTKWFARHGVEPVRITYESLSNEPQAVLATVLSALGLDPDIAETVEPRTAKLADSESLEWVTRFRAERRSPPA
jgi:trehalose 2-sulfotransferase